MQSKMANLKMWKQISYKLYQTKVFKTLSVLDLAFITTVLEELLNWVINARLSY